MEGLLACLEQSNQTRALKGCRSQSWQHVSLLQQIGNFGSDSFCEKTDWARRHLHVFGQLLTAWTTNSYMFSVIPYVACLGIHRASLDGSNICPWNENKPRNVKSFPIPMAARFQTTYFQAKHVRSTEKQGIHNLHLRPDPSGAFESRSRIFHSVLQYYAVILFSDWS